VAHELVHLEKGQKCKLGSVLLRESVKKTSKIGKIGF
jgi:hypothetical protein